MNKICSIFILLSTGIPIKSMERGCDEYKMHYLTTWTNLYLFSAHSPRPHPLTLYLICEPVNALD